MNPIHLTPGDIIYAKEDIINDGSHPGLPENALIAGAGTRGVLVNIGEIELGESEDKRELLLARFEGEDLVLGPPIGCWPEEIIGLEEKEAQKS